MTSHPGFEDLSAYHDGEAPEWASHVASCADCRARLDQLADLSAAVAHPPEGPPAAGDAVALAMAAAEAGPVEASAGAGEAPVHPVTPLAGDRPATPSAPPGPAHPERARWLAWVTAASAAAVLVLVVGVLTLVNRSDSDRTTGSALTESERSTPGSEASPADQGANMAADSPAPGAAPAPGPALATAGGDLGEVGDAQTLVARVRPSLGGSREAAGAPRIVGTYPCEGEARAAAPALGPVVYQATARVQGTPAVVLGFSPPGEAAPVTIQARAQSGCRLLLSASSP